MLLLTNDDGIHAAGIARLRDALSALDSLLIVAPDRDCSATGASLTIRRPVSYRELAHNLYSVEGTPGDCVFLAALKLTESLPRFAISGINDKANLGDDILFSGTVAAALVARTFGIPAIAVSMVGGTEHFHTAAMVVKQMIAFWDETAMPDRMIFNVNVPNCPLEAIKGIKLTHLGHRHMPEPFLEDKDPRGNEVFWVPPPATPKDEEKGSDFHAVKNRYVSITPIQYHTTDRNAIQSLSPWLNRWTTALYPKAAEEGMV